MAKLAAAALVLLGAGAGWKGYRAYRGGARDLEPIPTKFAAPFPIDGHQLVTLTTRGGLHIAASFVPPKNGVAVVLGHGAQGSRAQLWGDVQLLANAGYGALALDWPGLGESEGTVTLGRPEREAFTAAVDFLAARDDVKRIGAYGFSQGGGLFTAFVSDEPRVASLLAVNAWTDKVTQLRWAWRKWGPVQQLPVEWAVRARVEGGNMSALEAAPRLQGRKTLFIASSADETVDPSMSKELAAAARGQTRVAEGASHMGYREAMPDWGAVLTGFFAE